MVSLNWCLQCKQKLHQHRVWSSAYLDGIVNWSHVISQRRSHQSHDQSLKCTPQLSLQGIYQILTRHILFETEPCCTSRLYRSKESSDATSVGCVESLGTITKRSELQLEVSPPSMIWVKKFRHSCSLTAVNSNIYNGTLRGALEAQPLSDQRLWVVLFTFNCIYMQLNWFNTFWAHLLFDNIFCLFMRSLCSQDTEN